MVATKCVGYDFFLADCSFVLLNHRNNRRANNFRSRNFFPIKPTEFGMLFVNNHITMLVTRTIDDGHAVNFIAVGIFIIQLRSREDAK